MSKYTKKVMELLKPKVKAFGFDKKELKSVAANIADNLDLEDDASDEDVDEAIQAQVDAAIPYLKLAQAAASRIVSAHQAEGDDDGDDGDEGAANRTKPGKGKSGKSEDEDSAVMKLLTEMKSEIASLKKERTENDYRSQVEQLFKGKSDKALKRELKRLARMNFADEDAFEEYLDDLKEELKDVPDLTGGNGDPGAGGNGSTKPEKELDTKDLDAIAGLIN